MGRKFIRERQQAGIEAKAKGVYKGRTALGMVQRPSAKALGISRMSVHRTLTGA